MRRLDSERRADLAADLVVVLMLLTVYGGGLWLLWWAWTWLGPHLMPTMPVAVKRPDFVPFAVCSIAVVALVRRLVRPRRPDPD